MTASALVSTGHQRLAFYVAVASLVVVGLAIVAAKPHPSIPHELTLVLREGEFDVPADAGPDQIASPIAADIPVMLLFRSEDYVYVVQHRETRRTVVVLPASESRLQITLPQGRSEFEIVQGCGRFSDSHRRSLKLMGIQSRR